jgi:hypothetical protein
VKQKNARMATFSKWFIRLIPLAVIVLTPSCLESKPKVLGKGKVEFSATDTANTETFRFNFAYRDGTTPSPVPVYLQGIANSNSVMTSTCNGAGTGCQCEFLQTVAGVDTVLSTATPAYDSIGNFFVCTYAGVLASLTKVRLKNISGSKTSTAVTVDTTLTAQKLVGSDLDVNKVRTVYQYGCQYNYLEKQLTTAPGSFTCVPSLNKCGVAGVGDFCFLQILYQFYVYSDNYSTNEYKQMNDLVYGAGTSNTLCGKQAKQYDCSKAANGQPTSLVKAFGLYSEQTGNFQVPVLLVPSPVESRQNYGYAAKVGSSGQCPPGMVSKNFFTAAFGAISGSTVPADSVVAIMDSASAPANLQVIRQEGDANPLNTGGVCLLENGGYVCYPPRGAQNALGTTYPYVAAGTPFCVINQTVLP